MEKKNYNYDCLKFAMMLLRRIRTLTCNLKAMLTRKTISLWVQKGSGQECSKNREPDGVSQMYPDQQHWEAKEAEGSFIH